MLHILLPACEIGSIRNRTQLKLCRELHLHAKSVQCPQALTANEQSESHKDGNGNPSDDVEVVAENQTETAASKVTPPKGSGAPTLV